MLGIIINLLYRHICRSALAAIRAQSRLWAWAALARLGPWLALWSGRQVWLAAG